MEMELLTLTLSTDQLLAPTSSVQVFGVDTQESLESMLMEMELLILTLLIVLLMPPTSTVQELGVGEVNLQHKNVGHEKFFDERRKIKKRLMNDVV